MLKQHRVHILVAEPSLIIRSGLMSVLLNFEKLRIDVAQLSNMFILGEEIDNLNPDIVILNPQYMGITSPEELKNGNTSLKFIALQNSLMSGEQLGDYDAEISILDSEQSIEQTISKLIMADNEGQVELSEREKDIVRGVARGMSNKEVADMLSISTNTVTTHRRNIATKLEIRNPAGLTIYAIVNGLIDISEVK